MTASRRPAPPAKPASPKSGEIALSVDAGQRQRLRGTDPVLQWLKWTAFGDPIHGMEGSAVGCSLLEDWLVELRAGVDREGMLTESAVGKLAARFGGKPNRLTLELEAFRRESAAARTGPDAPLPEREMAATLALLDRKIRELRNRRNRHLEDELHEDEARQAAAVLPSGKVLDKILRYETKLERQLYRAMAQLERVQRLRNGEAVPAPWSVQVSERG